MKGLFPVEGNYLVVWNSDIEDYCINPAFLLNSLRKIEPDDTRLNAVKCSDVAENLDDIIVYTCVVVDEDKDVPVGVEGELYFLSQHNMESKYHVVIENEYFSLVGFANSEEHYIDHNNNKYKARVGHFFNCMINTGTNVEAIVFHKDGFYYKIDVPESLKNISRTNITQIPEREVNMRRIDDSWEILGYHSRRSIYLDTVNNEFYKPVIKKSSIQSSYSLNQNNTNNNKQTMLYVIVNNATSNDLIFMEENNKVVRISYKTTKNKHGETVFVLKPIESKEYKFFYFNSRLKTLHDYGFFYTGVECGINSPIKLNQSNVIDTHVTAGYHWVSINVKPKNQSVHTIHDVFKSLISGQDGLVLEAIRTRNKIWIFNKNGVVGREYDENSKSWRNLESNQLSMDVSYILKLKKTKHSYRWYYEGSGYETKMQYISLKQGVNYMTYPLKTSNFITHYQDLLDNAEVIMGKDGYIKASHGETVGNLKSFEPNKGYIVDMKQDHRIMFMHDITGIRDVLFEKKYCLPSEWRFEYGTHFELHTLSYDDIKFVYDGTEIILSNTSNNSLFDLKDTSFEYYPNDETFKFVDYDYIESVKCDISFDIVKNERYEVKMNGKITLTFLNDSVDDFVFTATHVEVFDDIEPEDYTPTPTPEPYTPTPTPTPQPIPVTKPNPGQRPKPKPVTPVPIEGPPVTPPPNHIPTEESNENSSIFFKTYDNVKSEMYLNVNRILDENGLDEMYLTMMYVKFANPPFIEHSTRNQTKYNLHFISNYDTLFFYSMDKKGVLLKRDEPFVAEFFHNAPIGKVPVLDSISFVSTSNFEKVSLSMVTTNISKKVNDEEFQYFGDVTKPHGSITIDDFVSLLKVHTDIPGYEYENIGSNVLNGDSAILKQKCHIFTHKMMSFEQMLVSPMNVMDLNEILKTVVGLQPPVLFDDKRFITAEAIVELGNDFSLTTTSMFDIGHFDGIMTNSIFAVTAYSGVEKNLDVTTFGTTKFKSNWKIRWSMEDSTLPLYFMYDFSGKEIPQMMIKPVGGERVSNWNDILNGSMINIGPFWSIVSDSESVKFYCDGIIQACFKKV